MKLLLISFFLVSSLCAKFYVVKPYIEYDCGENSRPTCIAYEMAYIDDYTAIKSHDFTCYHIKSHSVSITYGQHCYCVNEYNHRVNTTISGTLWKHDILTPGGDVISSCYKLKGKYKRVKNDRDLP